VRVKGDAGAVVVAAVGLACLDHVWHVERFPPIASRTYARTYRSHGGGPAATAAVAVARLGGSAVLWASLGDDGAGDDLAQELARERVRLHAIRSRGGRSFVSAILVDPAGERHIFPFRGEGLADEPAALDWSDVATARALLTDARHPRLSQHALDQARRHGIPTVGDWSDLRHWEQTAAVDHLIVSEECARQALGEADPSAALGRLRRRSDQLVAVTLGPRGIVWDAGHGVRRCPAPRVEVLDSTGAGDAFHGGYAYAIASGRSAGAAMRLASAVGALACTGLGRESLPDLATAERLAATLPVEESA
jgi:sulfofructose kinase